ncbi:winged helix-turn-helix transcriptional regulator [Salinigranum halophilum]|uniref:winged helix-turn-helix transcriptional regulator n=1 Tax=Salinigranum halophilum TaxID=2565931 RepID=UPI0010A77999|nr:helix-turn-helix domain-containing protein [Salinigranum halophilum]
MDSDSTDSDSTDSDSTDTDSADSDSTDGDESAETETTETAEGETETTEEETETAERETETAERETETTEGETETDAETGRNETETRATERTERGTSKTAVEPDPEPAERTEVAVAAGNDDDDSGGSEGVDSTGFGPESAGTGVAIGAGALAAGAIARRVAFSGSTGASASAASVASTTATTAPRGLARLARSSLVDLANRVQAVASDWVGRVLAAAGYTKWAGNDPLEHDTRAELYDHVQAEPGTYLSAFEDAPAVDATLGTVRYHLKILERERLVTSEKVQGKRRYYPIGSSPDALDVALEGDSTRAILEALTASPDSVSGLADRVDRDPSTVSHHLTRLEAQGLVERERDGQTVTNRLTPGVEALLSQGPFAESGPGADRTAADD